MNKDEFEQKCKQLLTKRQIFPPQHTAAERFCEDFKVYAWWHAETDPSQFFDLLSNDSLLVPSTKMNTNFTCNLHDLISPELTANSTFSNILPTLIQNKGKGIGVGELVLPLIINGWTFATSGDGFCLGGKREVKEDGASLKPLATGITEKGLIDKLNVKYFQGIKPGLVKFHKKHSAYVSQFSADEIKQLYTNYFTELYPGNDVTTLAEEIADNYSSVNHFNWTLGKHVLKWYKSIDDWHSIVVIDPETLNVMNVFDVDNLDESWVKFQSKMDRKRDTQAVPDGYVNISLAKKKKAK